MFYYLVYFISCTQVFDFRGESFVPSMDLYMKPFDQIEVKVKKGTITFLSDLSKIYDLYFDVDAGDPPGKIDTYGKYDRSSYIMGIIFESKNYTIRFIYEGASSIKFGLLFCSEDFFFEYPNNNLKYTFIKYENPFDLTNKSKFSDLTFIIKVNTFIIGGFSI